MPGSHMLPGYYSMRRPPYLTDSDFSPSTKQYSSDPYSSALGGKALSFDHTSTYPAYIDSYYTPESFGDYRGATAFSTSGGSLFPTSSLPHLLPPLPGESSNLLLRDSWEQSDGHSMSQDEVPVPTTATSGLASPDTDSPSLYRLIPGRSGGSTLSGSQPYSLHPLEEVHYPGASYSPSSSYPSSYTYLTSPGETSGVKVSPVPSEDPGSVAVTLSDASWAKDDGTGSWLPYEPRKAY
ncbi:POU class 2 homeobox associating-factor 2 [Oncorhynchus clarkii lewisi]|uniref:POU class 2 homeobox associating-factor 2 n=1 Tax=Oncorhynchus clarkii lewisi TaxID=490388 RepID=UPI0039B84AFE